MSFTDSMDILSSALTAQRVRINASTSNMANAQTTRTKEGGAYQRRDPVFMAAASSSEGFASDFGEALQKVEVSDVQLDQSPSRQVYNPKHPDADVNGYVGMPNIVMVEEMVNMMVGTRSYEAAITAMHNLVSMAEKAMSIGK